MTYNKIDVPAQSVLPSSSLLRRQSFSSCFFLFAILCTILIADFTFTDRQLWLYHVIRNHWHPSAHTIIPGYAGEAMPLNIVRTMPQALAFLGLFVVVFLFYLLALRILPRHISHRYIIVSTTLIGFAYMLIPFVTSQDVFSYIAYARMAVLYHFNPMVTPPTVIHSDYIYGFLYWVNQPSVYGPTWLAVTASIQLLATAIGFKYVLSMQLLLRLFAFAMHLGSVQMIWKLSGRLQDRTTDTSLPVFQNKRLLTTLAFAWNPFLLLEACVNAHNDVTLLFMLLLALWWLLPRPESIRQPYVLASVLFALMAGLKISYIVLVPGLFLFILFHQTVLRSWPRRFLDMGKSLLIYSGIIIVCHAPFWAHGALLHVFTVTPSASRDINSIYEFLVHGYAQLRGIPLPRAIDSGSHQEVLSHVLSMAVFMACFGILCLRTFLRPQLVNTLSALIGWLTCLWLLYCIVGSPWFWPWYAIIIFGLLALLEVTQYKHNPTSLVLFSSLDISLFGILLSISMMGLYCLWIFYNLLPNFQLTYLTSLLIWGVPFLIIWLKYRYDRHRDTTFYQKSESAL
ncbi:hypothetical protein [Dictyobacter arantiisoli]|uniref:Glycosyltransferase RgtA/B/C/D-like domain-containing protein n=1 Tax=Dictyobacter arantiisoli TaxID=2014874 RepID=A0A5A5TC65_9CHLR|nr:hypothetical protein [Dictyobacter arantiisoli]GCF08795.1 hypothetical protein KDI_23590 [Dictyobacter arantiisoli]